MRFYDFFLEYMCTNLQCLQLFADLKFNRLSIGKASKKSPQMTMQHVKYWRVPHGKSNLFLLQGKKLLWWNV